MHSLGDELRTIVGADIPWGTTQHEQLRQQLDDIDRLETARHTDGETFARELIDRVEHPVLAPVLGAVLDEVIAPHMVCMLGPQAHARAVGEPQTPTFRLLGRHLEPRTPPDALYPLVVDHPAALRAQQLGNLAIAVAATGPGQGNDVLGQFGLIMEPLRRLALRRAVLPECSAGTALRDAQFISDMLDTETAARGAQKFPRTASCKMTLSRVRSDTARRRRAFSVSSSLRRLT